MKIEVGEYVRTKSGKIDKFKCPICGEEASGIKNTYNGHLWAQCEKCKMNVIQ